MPYIYTIQAPLPQLKHGIGLSDYNLGDSLSIRPLEPQLRRRLLNTAKEHKPKCSDDCLLLQLESESLFCAQIPTRDNKTDGSAFGAIVYTTIAQEILRRIFRCLLLFDWVPAPLLTYCWFLAAGSADNMHMNTLKILTPNWEYINIFENIDWRSGVVEPKDITLGLIGLQKYWSNVSVFCQIEQLKAIFTDKEKGKGIFASANQYVERKVEELMRAKYGPDACIVDGDSDANAKKKSNGDDLPTTKISKKMWSKWFFPALIRAYQKEVDKLSQELNRRVLNKRFDRAFQFFTDAFRATEPHRFISFATCLESLFCTSRNEITFQLASRVAWFLSPEDCEERSRIFAKVKTLYGIRSDIVHGTKYSPDKIEESEPQLTALARRTFQRILSNNSIYDIFRHKEQKVCNKYLEDLNLGKISPDKIA